jgi:hypothetical protein
MTMTFVLGTGLGVRYKEVEVEYSGCLEISFQKLLLSETICRCPFQIAGSRGYRLIDRVVI